MAKDQASSQTAIPSSYYWAPIETFLLTDSRQILGWLTAAHDHALDVEQRRAWEEEIALLHVALAECVGTIYIEFDVPRLGSRIDAVVISGPAIFPMEFKCGEREYRTADYNQSWDYALDLKNFHEASHAAPIFPILIATAAEDSDESWQPSHEDGVHPPRRCSGAEIARALKEGLASVRALPLDGEAWGSAPYHPTPTIVEAARALYSRHSVEAISRSDAGARNLSVTSGAVEEIIERSRQTREKAIVFVTGVPGAGKTLVGLNVATRRREFGDARAVFLSGNGPLVAVLQEALIRDELTRLGNRVRRGTVRQRVKPLFRTCTTSVTRASELPRPLTIMSSSSTKPNALGTGRRPPTS